MSDLMNKLCKEIQPLLESKGVETDELTKLAYCFAIGIANPETRKNTESKLHTAWRERFDEARGILLLNLLLEEPSVMSVIIAFGDEVGHHSTDMHRPAAKFNHADSESKMRLAKSSVKDFAKIVYPSIDWEKDNHSNE